jgi:hypothetical protein
VGLHQPGHADVVSNKHNLDASAGPPLFGLPENSALTIEGRIERAAGVATHLVRVRDGLERPLRSSNWAMGLVLILAALAVVVGAALALNALG